VNVTALTPEARRRSGIPARLNGLMVTSVADDSPYRDQLVPNVLIVQIDREDVTDLASAKTALNPGRHMLYVFYHGGMRVVRLDVE
jgi:serine protease Do/serine protease DegQ